MAGQLPAPFHQQASHKTLLITRVPFWGSSSPDNVASASCSPHLFPLGPASPLLMGELVQFWPSRWHCPQKRAVLGRCLLLCCKYLYMRSSLLVEGCVKQSWLHKHSVEQIAGAHVMDTGIGPARQESHRGTGPVRLLEACWWAAHCSCRTVYLRL